MQLKQAGVIYSDLWCISWTTQSIFKIEASIKGALLKSSAKAHQKCAPVRLMNIRNVFSRPNAKKEKK